MVLSSQGSNTRLSLGHPSALHVGTESFPEALLGPPHPQRPSPERGWEQKLLQTQVLLTRRASPRTSCHSTLPCNTARGRESRLPVAAAAAVGRRPSRRSLPAEGVVPSSWPAPLPGMLSWRGTSPGCFLPHSTRRVGQKASKPPPCRTTS